MQRLKRSPLTQSAKNTHVRSESQLNMFDILIGILGAPFEYSVPTLLVLLIVLWLWKGRDKAKAYALGAVLGGVGVALCTVLMAVVVVAVMSYSKEQPFGEQFESVKQYMIGVALRLAVLGAFGGGLTAALYHISPEDYEPEEPAKKTSKSDAAPADAASDAAK